MRYVILGGGGVFGVQAAKYLLENAEPEQVVSIGRNPEKPEPFTLNVGKGDPRYAYHSIHIYYEMDRLIEVLDEVRPQVVVNIAAQGEGAVSWKKSWRFFETNAVALAKITEELAERDYLQRWIQIGTSELYGSVDRPAPEDTPIQPTSPYAASKAAGDMHLLSISKVLDFPMNIIRPSNAYAPGQLLHRVIPKAVVCGLVGERLPLHGGGRARKSYIHAYDLGRAIHLVATKAPLGTVYNAGPAEPISIRDLVAATARALDLSFEDLCEVTGDRLGQDAQYWLDSSAIRRDVGWEPQIDLETGLRDMVDWGRKYIDVLRDWPKGYTLRA